MTSDIHYLGLDTSLTHTGVVVVDASGTAVRATTLSVARTGAARLATLGAALAKVLEQFPRESFHAWAVEGANYGNAQGAYGLGEASGVCKATAFPFLLVEPVLVAPAQLKKFATGHADADKALVIASVASDYGFAADDDHQADAFVLARIARALATRCSLPRRAQVEVVHALQRKR